MLEVRIVHDKEKKQYQAVCITGNGDLVGCPSDTEDKAKEEFLALVGMFTGGGETVDDFNWKAIARAIPDNPYFNEGEND